jgi:hypothetical protein
VRIIQITVYFLLLPQVIFSRYMKKFNFIENRRKKALRSSGIVEAGDSDSYNNKICLRLSA